jgi:hypothetical protein
MAEPKKKSALLMVFGKPKDGPEHEEPEDGDGADGEDMEHEADGGEDEDFEQACDEMMVAIKSGDKAGFCEAFKAAFEILDSKEDEEEEGNGKDMEGELEEPKKEGSY